MSPSTRLLRATIFTLTIFGLLRFFGMEAPVVAQESVASPHVTAQRFESMDILVDSKEVALGAWQVDVTTSGGTAKIVGIEGGEHEAYREPPFYDPKALLEPTERVVLAAFRASGDLPKGRTRVARVHFFIEEAVPVSYQARLIASGDADGKSIEATVHLSRTEEGDR